MKKPRDEENQPKKEPRTSGDPEFDTFVRKIMQVSKEEILETEREEKERKKRDGP